jgi:alcohol dehydrogenase, propanol-preferring
LFPAIGYPLLARVGWALVLAAVLRSPGRPLVFEDRRDLQPVGDQRVVRVRGAGVCHSDLHMIDGEIGGPLPRVLGHEIAGHVAGIGNVLVYPCWSDGTCGYCRRGLEQLCPAAAEPGWAVDGGFAGQVLVPHPRFLLPLEGLDPVRAAPLADAGVTPYRAVRRALPWLTEGATALVLGAGGLGQFAIQYLRLLTGATVVAVDPSEPKRRRALALGAHDVAAPGDGLPAAAVVFDLVGSDATLRQAVECVLPAGMVMVVGEAGGRVPFGFRLVPYEAHLTSSVWGSFEDLRAVVGMAQRGDLSWDVEPMPLARANEALTRLRDGEAAGRIVLIP